jgi:hypothetical protein
MNQVAHACLIAAGLFALAIGTSNATTIVKSKSNITNNRTTHPVLATPAEAAIVKSKSNITNNRSGRTGAGSGGDAPTPSPADAAVVKSKSNITNNRIEGTGVGTGGGTSTPSPADTAVVKSKSNISNNRTAGGQLDSVPGWTRGGTMAKACTDAAPACDTPKMLSCHAAKWVCLGPETPAN